jgi:hypothetical protein
MEAPVLDRTPPVTERRTGWARAATDEIKTGWAVFLGVGWPVALVLSDVIRPAPADPNAAPSLLGQIVTLAVFGALVLTIVGAVSRLRSAGGAGVVLGGIMLADSVACPLSGHHQFGLWVAADMALFTGMLGLSIAALCQGARATEAS